MNRKVAPLVLGLALLTACSAPTQTAPSAPPGTAVAADTPTPTSPAPVTVTYGPGEYFFSSTTKAVGKFTVPGKPDGALEQLRTVAGGAPVQYLTVRVDNRHGTDFVNMYSLKIIDSAGKATEFKAADGIVGAWSKLGPVASGGTEVQNRFIAAQNEAQRGVPVGEVGDVVMAAPAGALPVTYGSVKVQVSGGLSAPEDAYPVSLIKTMGGSVNLDF